MPGSRNLTREGRATEDAPGNQDKLHCMDTLQILALTSALETG